MAKRIGEILLEHGWVDWHELALALDDQRGTDMRLCSLLVARGVIDFDRGARALGLRHHVAAAMQRHLECRDRAVAALLPVDLMRAAVALPIGQRGDGTLIVCVRDPSAKLYATLRQHLGGPFVLAVAPAYLLERIVTHVVTQRAHDFDIEVDPGVSGELDVSFDDDAGDPAQSFDDMIVEVEPPDEPAPAPVPAPAARRSQALPVQIKAVAKPAAPVSPHTLEGALTALADVDELEWMLDAIMAYVSRAWTAALVLELRGSTAVALRAHGPAAARRPTLPIEESPLVGRAIADRGLVHEDTRDPRLAALLGGAAHPVAAAVLHGGRVSHVIVVGDPPSGDAESAAVELSMLAEAVGEALARIG